MGKPKLNRYDQVWERNFKRLERFVKREGHATVLVTHVEWGFKLGQWVVEQRSNQKKMPKERRSALEGLPGWMWSGEVYASRWEWKFDLLMKFVHREGHARVM